MLKNIIIIKDDEKYFYINLYITWIYIIVLYYNKYSNI